MKRKIITFIVASIIYGFLYYGILFFIENDYSEENKILQSIFFGLGMGFFETFIRTLLINSLKKK